jgi:polar amino acid transport system ATP-binding protein
LGAALLVAVASTAAQSVSFVDHLLRQQRFPPADLRAIDAGAAVLGMTEENARGHATEYLERVGLSDKLDAYPKELSGGQKQRVAIARALAMRPPLMLFDEITSALDPELVGGILEVLRELSASREMTMLIVTHEMGFARESSDRVLFFDDGRVLEDALPDQMFTAPRHERTSS